MFLKLTLTCINVSINTGISQQEKKNEKLTKMIPHNLTKLIEGLELIVELSSIHPLPAKHIVLYPLFSVENGITEHTK